LRYPTRAAARRLPGEADGRGATPERGTLFRLGDTQGYRLSEGNVMGQGDDQLSMDLGVPVEQTAWGKWVDPDRRKAQARKFMEHVGISRIPSKPWPEDAAEVKRLDPIVAELFPDMATAMAPENADIADAFVCFIGECFIRFAGADWVDYEWFGREYSLYDHVNPALLCDTHDEDEIVAWRLVKDIINYNPGDHAGMFSYLAAALREYASYHEEKREDMAGPV
jgi:hypothetical protein